MRTAIIVIGGLAAAAVAIAAATAPEMRRYMKIRAM
jgi:hypothetical protein